MKIKKTHIPFFLLILFVTSCSLDKNVDSGTQPDIPSGTDYKILNPVPTSGTIVQTRNVQLNWFAEGSPSSFKIIFDTHPEASNVLVNSTSSVVVHKSRLREGNTYYWKVIATYPDGTIITSPEWNFVVDNLYPDGSTLVKHKSQTADPSNVQVMLQLSDLDNKGITDFTVSDFQLFEDGEFVHDYESWSTITRPNTLPNTLRTIIMIDNSSSVDVTELEILKNAALEFLSYGVEQNQITSLYTFSESINKLSDFTNDYYVLEGLVSSISHGEPSTDLYGAVIDGVKMWSDIYNDSFANQGVLIIFTDGKDTQSKHTLDEAIEATNGKQVIMVSYDYLNQIDLGILKKLATDDLYYTTEMQFLKDRMTEYKERLELYSNSFYWLDYRSPKRGDAIHQLTIRILNNVYEGVGSEITTEYSSKDFK